MDKLFVDASINGETREFIFDTGSPTLITREFADALAATLDSNGIVSLPEGGGAGAFSVATSNLGAFGTLDVSVERGDGAPVFDLIDLCATDPNTGQCITARAPVLRRDFAAGGTQTFAVFVRHAEPVANSPAVNRVFVHFRTTTGQSVGATSVAVRTR